MARKKKTETKRPIESYEHRDKRRVNNPPVGLVTPDTDPDAGAKNSYAYDPHLDPVLNFDARKLRDELAEVIQHGLSARTIDEAKAALETIKRAQEPYLNWAGKAEHASFEVPTVSLHVHERIDPRTIIEAVRRRNGNGGGKQLPLFASQEENPPLRQAVEFYQHAHGWSNRLIAGDSLLVMNSLLEKEGMAGKVQMVYLDPPYGIRYGSNFQPFVNKRDVKDGKDEDLTAEPEQIKAFRDTWELGIHSYITYLRDRLLLARELLIESGSIFVQISDDNLHHVRELMDEVFGPKNFVAQVTFQKTGSIESKLLSSTVDYLVWYARDISKTKYRPLYKQREVGDTSLDRYDMLLFKDGSTRRLNPQEIETGEIPDGSRRYQLAPLYSEGASSSPQQFEFQGNVYLPRPDSHWKTTVEGLNQLAAASRIEVMGSVIRYRRFADDFPVLPIGDRWESMQIGTQRVYVVQTAPTVPERCILMTTNPGDLVFDPTCGSGTTAYVAEQWGRRWVTCDTSRVALTLAKQRLMTAVFDYYELAHPQEGVGSGFKYKTVPHVTLKSIANNPEIVVDSGQCIVDSKEKAGGKKLATIHKPLSTKAQSTPPSPATRRRRRSTISPSWTRRRRVSAARSPSRPCPPRR